MDNIQNVDIHKRIKVSNIACEVDKLSANRSAMYVVGVIAVEADF